jgi:hypothetical protein
VDTIAAQEIDAALLQIATLIDRLRLMTRALTTLGEMKQALSGAAGDELGGATDDVEGEPSGPYRFDSTRGH